MSEAVETAVTPEQATDVETSASVEQSVDNVSQFPENWRERMAGDNEAAAKLLGRYKTPEAAAKALVDFQTKARTSEAMTKPENGTEEELAAWREDQGIPQTWEDYDTELGDGLIIGEEDKPILDSVLQAMHAADAKPEQVKAALNAYYVAREAEQQQIEVRDNEQRETAINTLRDEWGSDYQSNMNMIRNLIGRAPESIRDDLVSARLPDGSALLNNIEALGWLADMERQINPTATVIPNTANPKASIQDELHSLEAKMANRSSDYWKGPNAEKNQARYRELTDVLLKMG